MVAVVELTMHRHKPSWVQKDSARGKKKNINLNVVGRVFGVGHGVGREESAKPGNRRDKVS